VLLRILMLLAAASVAIILGSCGSSQNQGEQVSPALSESGQQLYNTNCLSCHGGPAGGSMSDMPPRHNANGHTWHHPDCQLIDIVLNGSGEMGEMMRRMMGKPDTPSMPAFRDRLTEEEVRAILAYIRTWWTEDQRQTQAMITRERCQG
jgi:mono/diheme cytochrome c family protein